MNGKTLSVVLPVYQAGGLVAQTLETLLELDGKLPAKWRLEIIAVDDGSQDDSFAQISAVQKRHPTHIRIVKLSRNFGTIAAIRAGMAYSSGDAVVFAAQDLQEPPELLLSLFNAWLQHGESIHIAYRSSRDEPATKKIPAQIYHWLFRTLVMPDYPLGGIATALIDRKIVDELRRRPQANLDLGTEIFSLGYKRRLHLTHRGRSSSKSNWTFTKNIKLAIDNFIGFSYLPVRLMSLAGIIVALASFCFTLYVFTGKLTGWYPINQPPGWATIVVLLTFLIGMVMLMLGVIGEYLWRILDAVRGEPLYRVEEVRDIEPLSKQNMPQNDAAD